MPRYYCDYCDTHLTHDSPSVRKTHCAGRKHIDNVRAYYQQWADERTQAAINAIIAAQKAGQFAPPPNAWPFAPPSNAMPPHMGGHPPPPNMYPHPMGFVPPNGMPQLPYMVPQGANVGPQPPRPYLGLQGSNLGPPRPYLVPEGSNLGLQRPYFVPQEYNLGLQMPSMMFSGAPMRYPMPQMPLVGPTVTYGDPPPSGARNEPV